jgi:hypothetical protein
MRILNLLVSLTSALLIFLSAAFIACNEEEMLEERTGGEPPGKTTKVPDPDVDTYAYVASDYVAVPLSPVNDSDVVGAATLLKMDGKTKVIIQLVPKPGQEDIPRPVHIHPGTCEEVNPRPKYPLNNVLRSKSETDVDVSLESLTTGSYAINVHKAPQELSTYVACGTIPKVPEK